MKKTRTYSLAMYLSSATVLALAGCGGGGSLASGDALNISGVLSLGNSSQSIEKVLAIVQARSEESVSIMSVDLSQYKVSCSTNSAPIHTAIASVASDGSFSVNIEGASGQPLSCFLVNANGDKAADFLISDSSKKDLNGNSEVSNQAAFKSNASLGTINFDPNAGEVTVPKSNIASAVANVATTATDVFDPTGSWTITAVDFTLPKGTKSPCTGGGGHNCDGPPDGQAIYLKLWKGAMISDNSDVYGLQVWQSQGQFNTCGGKIGLTNQIKNDLGVDFSANVGADTTFTFANSVSNFTDQVAGGAPQTVNLTDGWKMDIATSQHEIMPKCSPHDVTISNVTYANAWVCGPDDNNRYQANLGGGCKDSNNNPVQLNDWSGMVCDQVVTSASGIKTSSCTGDKSIDGQLKTITCTNKWAVTDNTYAVQTGVEFNWSALNASKISSGVSCASIANGGSSEELKIAQLQCYADYYWRSGMEQANACLPRVDMDWSATTSANFAMVDKIRPQGLIFFEKYKPLPDGSGGSLLTRQEHYAGVNVDGTSWVNCRVVEVGGLSIKKVSATKLLATYQSSLITTSTTKPACLAAFNGTRETFMFYLNK